MSPESSLRTLLGVNVEDSVLTEGSVYPIILTVWISPSVAHPMIMLAYATVKSEYKLSSMSRKLECQILKYELLLSQMLHFVLMELTLPDIIHIKLFGVLIIFKNVKGCQEQKVCEILAECNQPAYAALLSNPVIFPG